MKKIFISRKLKPNSPFKLMLEAEGFEVIGQSLINFRRIPFLIIPPNDWLFFYSKNGVKYFFETIKDDFPINWKEYNRSKYAAMGNATAAALKKQGISPDFIGSGDPEQTAKEFSKLIKNERVLFVRAKNSRSSVARILEGQIKSEELKAYDNIPVSKPIIPVVDGLVFTSPMNAQCYFQHYSKQQGQKIFAMGKTTAAVLKELKAGTFSIASKPSEQALAKMVIERFKV